MPPAHQGFEADELAVDAHLRLIVQHELLRDAVPQVILERAALAQRRIGIAIEKSHRAAAVDLGAVQAASAFAVNVAASPPSTGNTAMPMLAPVGISLPPALILRLIARRSAGPVLPRSSAAGPR